MPARHRPQAWILIEISWGPHASLADYPSFASRRSIDEPQELADRPNPRSRYSTAALPDCTENRRFAHVISLGWRENLLQAVLQGGLAGPAALYLFVKSIAFIGAGRAAIFFWLVPPFVLLIGWLALGEMPSPLQLIGLLVVLFGFQLTQGMKLPAPSRRSTRPIP
jgi:hypothetical protein